MLCFQMWISFFKRDSNGVTNSMSLSSHGISAAAAALFLKHVVAQGTFPNCEPGWQPMVEVGSTGSYNLDGNYYGGQADTGSGTCYTDVERSSNSVEQLNSRYGGTELHDFTVSLNLVSYDGSYPAELATTGGAAGASDQKFAVWLDGTGNICAGAHYSTASARAPGCSVLGQECVSSDFKICTGIDLSTASKVDILYNADTRYGWEVAASTDPAHKPRAEIFIDGDRANVGLVDLTGKVSSMRSSTTASGVTLSIVDDLHPSCIVGGSPATWKTWKRTGIPSDRLFWDGCDWQLQRKHGFPSGPFSSTCEDQVDAANFIFCTDVSEWSTEICSAVKDAGYCSNSLTRALCPAACAWPYPPTCINDDADAARELHTRLGLSLPEENLARDQGQYLCNSLCNVHGLSYDAGVNAVCKTTCPGNVRRRRLAMDADHMSKGLFADRRLVSRYNDTAVGRWSSFLWANAPTSCTPSSPDTSVLTDTDLCDAHTFDQAVTGLTFTQVCPTTDFCYDTVTTGYCKLEHVVSVEMPAGANASLCHSVCDTNPSHSGCELEEENDWNAICDTRANCEAYCTATANCLSVDMAIGYDRCYLNTATSATCTDIHSNNMYAILDKRAGGHGHNTCWGTTHEKYLPLNNIDPVAAGISQHTCVEKCRGSGSTPEHSDCRGAENFEDLVDDGSENYALCVTRETCESLCDSTPGCHSIDMHRSLPRCLLNGVYTAPEDVADSTTVTTEYDFLTRTRNIPCHWTLAVDNTTLPDAAAIHMYSPTAASVADNLAPTVGKYNTVTTYDGVGAEVNTNDWAHETAASASITWDAAGCRWQLSYGEVLLYSNVWLLDGVRCDSVANGRVDERPSLDSVHWYLDTCPRRVDAYWNGTCEWLTCPCRGNDQCVTEDYQVDRCMKFHNGDLGLTGAGTACDTALDAVHAHSMVANNRGETWYHPGGVEFATHLNSSTSVRVSVTDEDFWGQTVDRDNDTVADTFVASVNTVIVSVTSWSGSGTDVAFRSGGKTDATAAIYSGYHDDFKTDLIRVVRHGADCGAIDEVSCATVQLSFPAGDATKLYSAFAYNSTGEPDAGLPAACNGATGCNVTFDQTLPVVNSGLDVNDNAVHSVEVCGPDMTFMLKEDIDECLSNPCTGVKVCTNTIGSYTCTCPAGSTEDTTVTPSVCVFPSIPVEDAPPLHTAVRISNQYSTCGSWQVAHFALFSDDSCQSQLSSSTTTRFESTPNHAPQQSSVMPPVEEEPAPEPTPAIQPIEGLTGMLTVGGVIDALVPPPEPEPEVPTTPDVPTTETPADGTETPVADGSETPATDGTETPATDVPADDTPASDVPAANGTETPVTETPATDGTETPATEETPVSDGTETPAADVPATNGTETPATDVPATETPSTETPAADTETPAADTPSNSSDGSELLSDAVVSGFNAFFANYEQAPDTMPFTSVPVCAVDGACTTDEVYAILRYHYADMSVEEFRAMLGYTDEEIVTLCGDDSVLINNWDLPSAVERLPISDALRQYSYTSGQFWSNEGLGPDSAYVTEISGTTTGVGSFKLVHNLENNPEHPDGVFLRTQRFAEATSTTNFTLQEQAIAAATVPSHQGARLEMAAKGLLAPRWGSSKSLSKSALDNSLTDESINGCFPLSCAGAMEDGQVYTGDAIHIFTNTKNDCDCQYLCQNNPLCHAFSFLVDAGNCTLHGTAATGQPTGSEGLTRYGTPGTMVTNVVEESVLHNQAITVSVEGKGLPTGIAARMSRIKLVPVADATSTADCSQRQPDGVLGIRCASSGVCATRPSAALDSVQTWDNVVLPFSTANPYFQVCWCQGRCSAPWQYLPVPNGRIHVVDNLGFTWTSTSLAEDTFDIIFTALDTAADVGSTMIKIVPLEGSRLQQNGDDARCTASASSAFTPVGLTQDTLTKTFTFDWASSTAKIAGGIFVVCVGQNGVYSRVSSATDEPYLVVASTLTLPGGFFRSQSFAANPGQTLAVSLRGSNVDSTGTTLAGCAAGGLSNEVIPTLVDRDDILREVIELEEVAAGATFIDTHNVTCAGLVDETWTGTVSLGTDFLSGAAFCADDSLAYICPVSCDTTFANSITSLSYCSNIAGYIHDCTTATATECTDDPKIKLMCPVDCAIEADYCFKKIDLAPDASTATTSAVSYTGTAPAVTDLYEVCLHDGGAVTNIGSLRVMDTPALNHKFILGGWDAQSLEITIPEGQLVRPDSFTEAIAVIPWDEVCGISNTVDYFTSSDKRDGHVVYRFVGHNAGSAFRLEGGRFRVCSQYSADSDFSIEIGEVVVSGAECAVRDGLVQNDEVCTQQEHGGKSCVQYVVPTYEEENVTAQPHAIVNPAQGDEMVPYQTLCVDEDVVF